MRVVSFSVAGQAAWGVLVGSKVVPSEQLGADVPQSLQSLFADGDQWAALIKVLPERAAGLPGLPLADVKLLPCVPRPGKIICLGWQPDATQRPSPNMYRLRCRSGRT